MGMQMLYAFQHCLEFISAVCLKLDLYLSSCHFCVPVFKILRVLSMNKSRNNMSWIKEEHYFVAVSKVKILKLKLTECLEKLGTPELPAFSPAE